MMYMRKMLAALTSVCMTATALLGSATFQSSAEGEKLTFDIRCHNTANPNTIAIDRQMLQSSDCVVPISIYVPENPGLFAASLKFQVNDGEVAEDGSFGNYGFYLESAELAPTYCFDSESEGMSSYAFQSTFNAEAMNLGWIYRMVPEANADAYAETGTTAWSNPEWAYEYAFATCQLVIPQGTPDGTYTFDVRRERYVNAATIGSEKPVYGQSLCQAVSENGSISVDYETIPLTIEVVTPPTTTTTESTTTTSTSQTTTSTSSQQTTTSTSQSTTSTEQTTTSTSQSTTSTEQTTTSTSQSTTSTEQTTTSTPQSTTSTEQTTTSASQSTTSTAQTTTNPVESTTTEGISTTTTEGTLYTDSYQVLEEGYYWHIADVCGKPGETVEVPIYVYGDPGTAGAQVLIDYDPSLKLTKMAYGRAYKTTMIFNMDVVPAVATFITNNGQNKAAEDGGEVMTLTFEIPAEATAGTTYRIAFHESEEVINNTDIRDKDGPLNVELLAGSVTVLADNETALNYSRYSFTEEGETVDLTLFNAHAPVTWSSSDESVATVNEQGFVTCVSLGDCVITATCGDQTYTCTIMGGLFGDIDGSGEVNAEDAVLALRCYVSGMMGDSILTPAQERIANVTGDLKEDGSENVTADDAVCILRYYVNSLIYDHVSWRELTGNENAPD